MGKVYSDNLDRPDPLVTVIERRGYWIAKSNSPECEKDVNDILQGMKYSGKGDVKAISERMKQHGFERTSPDRDSGGEKGDRYWIELPGGRLQWRHRLQWDAPSSSFGCCSVYSVDC